jgi:hypothetical protein
MLYLDSMTSKEFASSSLDRDSFVVKNLYWLGINSFEHHNVLNTFSLFNVNIFPFSSPLVTRILFTPDTFMYAVCATSVFCGIVYSALF